MEEITEPQLLALPIETAQAILNYLIQQPFKDVAHLIDGLKDLKTVNILPAEDNEASAPKE